MTTKISKSNKPQVIKIKCTECGGGDRNHLVLKDYSYNDSDEHVSYGGTYQICQCQGCESIRFRKSTWHSEDFDYDSDGNMEPNYDVAIYPDESDHKHYSAFNFVIELPEEIGPIYEETVKAINMGVNILAGGGLRAIVEAICKEKAVGGVNLKDKIDNLKKKDFLTQAQADLLHEERYIGNKALHEITAPSSRDLRDGLDIIESMLKTIYVLPEKAESLRKRRLSGKK